MKFFSLALVFMLVGLVSCNPVLKKNATKQFQLNTLLKANWHRAQHYCLANEMKLAKISTEEEYYQLRKQLEESGFTTPFWLGGTKIDDPEFYWFGHNAPVSFTAWNSNEPNNSGGKESCIAAQPKNDYKWNDEDCSIQFYFICEGMVEQ